MANRFVLSLSIVTLLTQVTAHPQDQAPTERLKTPAVENIPSTPTLDEVVVTDTAEPAYGAADAFTGTKTQARLLETPQAISVVTRQLLDDQGGFSLEQALQNVAGISTGGYYGDWDYYRIRGFDSAFTTYWDGLRGDYGKNVEIFGVERIEILKGPASALYGQGPLGGLVNIVSKTPRPENFADVQFTLGSYDFIEPAIDAGLVLNSAKTVYLRLNAVYRSQQSFIDYVDKERVFIAPSLTWGNQPRHEANYPH